MKHHLLIGFAILFFASNSEAQSLCLNSSSGAITTAKICPRGTTKATLSSLLVRSIPKGATVFGVIGGRFYSHAAGDSFDTYSSLPNKTTPAFDSESDIQVGHTFACPNEGDCLGAEENDLSAVCTGSAANPTAPAGKVCIYPTTVGNARFLAGFNLVDGFNPDTPNSPTPLSFSSGFGLGWESEAAGDSYVSAVWAYKAP